MPFKAGQSGNPGGKKKVVDRKQYMLKDLLMPLVPDAVRVIREALACKDGKSHAWASAEVLNRVYGKAPQSVEVAGKDGGPIQWTFNISLKDPDKKD